MGHGPLAVTMCAIWKCFSVMSVGLAVLGLVNAITIDNHLVTTKNDCYERLALGQRLDPRDVTQSLPARTAQECQAACSEEDQRCLSLSFGISPKGNGTCELSYAPVRETADLQPIGTKRDPDFDLYIKKVDCKLNIPKDPPASDVQNPTYAVAVVDRPSGSPGHGYEVQEPSPRPPPRRPVPRPPDVLVFHGERPGSASHPAYQNYYDVPRPLPLAYGPDRDREPVRPALDYPHDDRYYYGMPRPGPDIDRYRPVYSEYYGQRRPERPYDAQYDRDKLYTSNKQYDNKRPINDERPYNTDRYQPYKPNALNPDNPNVYDGISRPSDQPYGPESNRRNPYIPANENTRPVSYDPAYDTDKRPYKPYYPESDYPVRRPSGDRPYDFAPDRRPPPSADRPYGSSGDRPYDIEPDRRPPSPADRPYGPSGDRPYNNEPDRRPPPPADRPYGSSGDRPYNNEPDRRPPPSADRPYGSLGDRPYDIEPDRRPPPPVNRPYGPSGDRPYDIGPDRPLPPHGPYEHSSFRPYDIESNRRGSPPPDQPYGPSDERPYDFKPERRPDRPYGPHHDNSYDQNRNENSPYRPGHIDSRPYGSHQDNQGYNDNRLYDTSNNEKRPYGPYLPEDIHHYDYRRPSSHDRDRPDRPYRPNNEEFRPYLDPQYGKRPAEKPYNSNRDKGKPDPENPNSYENKAEWDRVGTGNGNVKPVDKAQQSPAEYNSKPQVHPQGPDNASVQATPQGGTVTSIITQIVEPCYRRSLAGKRIARSFIRRAVPCERVEDCQRECQNEKRFVCEGFNYRLDESGRGQGDCELTDLPLSRMDPGRDIIPDRDYDFYEKDRNSGPDCRPLPPPLRPPPGHGGGHGGSSWHPHYPPPPHRRPALPPPPPPPPSGPHYFGDRRKDVTGPGSGYYHGYYYYSDSDRNRYGYNYGPGYNYPPESRPHFPMPPPSRPHYGSHYDDRERDRGYWGVPMYGHGYGHTGGTGGSSYGWNRSHFVPYRVGQVGGSQDWGRYGGSYGGGYPQHDAYNYWGFNRHDTHDTRRVYHLPAPPPPPPPSGPSHYLPRPHHYEPPLPPHREPPLPPHREPPLPPRREPPPPPHREPPPPPPLPHFPLSGHGHTNHIGYDGYHPGIEPGHSYPRRDDCSTRRGMGFRLHKGVVKKFYAVPNIHECEKLCYREKDFNCVSFSFRNVTDSFDPWVDTDDTYETDWTVEERIIHIPRYAITLSSPTDNCYLSDRPYNDLDFYTELEPDRDFDIYTMHRTQSCLVPVVQEESECFLRVRSGQRLDSSVVKDSINAKSIVECQLECLTAARFTCRSFSFRWGPPHNGGAIDSCQLSDWPFTELDPRRDLVPEPGYEVYERGSYGHGCEQNHFEVPGHHGHLGPGQHIGDGSAVPKYSDKICYVGYAKPARLTPDAAKGALSVSSELDCKAECTRAREQSAFQCMSFSFRNSGPHNQPNCELSDVEQRDLRPELDYRRDPESWLFAWDSLSPQCSALLDQEHGGHDHGQDHVHNPLDTWRVYSVSGWPCRRGTTCQENREAGFWSCELEGGDVGSWDYCCRPDHHCGYSEGYNYPWCYVGPSRDQWRTCSDRYYPYLQHQQQQQHEHQRHPGGESYLPHSPGSGHSKWYSERPYRPPYARPAPGPDPAHRPSLDEYEDKFHQQFLEPPKPGGLGRHWPVSYLHKETPPNANISTTTSTPIADERQHRKMDSAISNVVQAIQAADLNNTRYHASNQSDGADDVLFVRLPMPTKSARLTEEDAHTPKFDVVDTKPQPQPKNKSSDGFDELFLISPSPSRNVTTPKRELTLFTGSAPIVRRGTITRTNRTARRRRLRPKNDLIQFIN